RPAQTQDLGPALRGLHALQSCACGQPRSHGLVAGRSVRIRAAPLRCCGHNLLVHALINPYGAARVPDAFPSILQDAIVIGLLVLIATFVFHDKLWTRPAVGAAVAGSPRP